MPGSVTLEAEVTSISPQGFRVLLGTEELLVPFSEFPWFRNATIEQIVTLQQPAPDHLYWPLLDVDLSVQSLRDPAAFPLRSARE